MSSKVAVVEQVKAVAPLTPEAQKSYKLPLPKTRSPMVATTTLANTLNQQKDMAVVAAAATPESLPEIHSEYAFIGLKIDHACVCVREDGGNTLQKKKVPAWAKTPALISALANQHGIIRPEDIFGDVQPVKLEGIWSS